MKPTKADVARQFGRMSHAYASSPEHARGTDLDILLQLLDLHPQMAVLDVATGAGHTAVAIAPYVARVMAIDLAPEMIEQVDVLAASRQLDNVRAIVMDGEALEFPDASFDIVTCRIAPHHFVDIDVALREIARVLRPGGQFGLEDSCAPADPALDRFLNDLEKLRDPTHVRSYTEAEWRAMLQAAGFEAPAIPVHCYRKTHSVGEWIERAGLDAATTEQVYAAFDAAPVGARQHFDLLYEDGRAVSFTDEKLILRVDRRRSNTEGNE
jgi:ubiquinone/menaquinone biosynthesis C-methylase UbiE